MPATYTSSLRLAKPANADTNWGVTVNGGVTDLVDSAIAGYTTVSMPSDADYTLIPANGSADQPRSMMLNITSAVSLTTTRNIICPSVSKLYVIMNATTGSQSIVIKTLAGTGVNVPNSAAMFVLCNGTDVVQCITNIGTVAVSAFSSNAQTTPVAVAFSATAMTVNCQLSNVFTTTFTANVTNAPTLSNPGDGQTINWFITQDGTGGRTMTWPSSFRWPSGSPTTLSTAANAVDVVSATYRSATGLWYASLLRSFA